MRVGPAVGALLVSVVVANPAAAASIHQYAIPTKGSQPLTIARGPDGAMWFAEAARNRIGRITSRGVVRSFKLPHAGSAPGQVALGPDRAIWFTEQRGNRIGRITTHGKVREFPIPTRQST